jgi:hypothetical protein
MKLDESFVAQRDTSKWMITKCRRRKHVWHIYGPVGPYNENSAWPLAEEYEYHSGADALRAFAKGRT